MFGKRVRKGIALLAATATLLSNSGVSAFAEAIAEEPAVQETDYSAEIPYEDEAEDTAEQNSVPIADENPDAADYVDATNSDSAYEDDGPQIEESYAEEGDPAAEPIFAQEAELEGFRFVLETADGSPFPEDSVVQTFGFEDLAEDEDAEGRRALKEYFLRPALELYAEDEFGESPEDPQDFADGFVRTALAVPSVTDIEGNPLGIRLKATVSSDDAETAKKVYDSEWNVRIYEYDKDMKASAVDSDDVEVLFSWNDEKKEPDGFSAEFEPKKDSEYLLFALTDEGFAASSDGIPSGKDVEAQDGIPAEENGSEEEASADDGIVIDEEPEEKSPDESASDEDEAFIQEYLKELEEEGIETADDEETDESTEQKRLNADGSPEYEEMPATSFAAEFMRSTDASATIKLTLWNEEDGNRIPLSNYELLMPKYETDEDGVLIWQGAEPTGDVTDENGEVLIEIASTGTSGVRTVALPMDVHYSAQETSISDEHAFLIRLNGMSVDGPDAKYEGVADSFNYTYVKTVTFENGFELPVTFRKLDQNKNRVEGAGMQILNSNGSVAYEWTTGSEDETVYLKPYTDSRYDCYYLHEAVVPDGYDGADDLKFYVYQEAWTTANVAVQNGSSQQQVEAVEMTDVKTAEFSVEYEYDDDGTGLKYSESDYWKPYSKPILVLNLSGQPWSLLRKITAENGDGETPENFNVGCMGDSAAFVSFRLQDGETAVLKNVPEGTEYSLSWGISNPNNNSYLSFSYENGTGTVNGEGTTAKAIGKLRTEDVEFTKDVVGYDDGSMFVIRLKLSDVTGARFNEKIKFTDFEGNERESIILPGATLIHDDWVFMPIRPGQSYSLRIPLLVHWYYDEYILKDEYKDSTADEMYSLFEEKGNSSSIGDPSNSIYKVGYGTSGVSSGGFYSGIYHRSNGYSSGTVYEAQAGFPTAFVNMSHMIPFSKTDERGFLMDGATMQIIDPETNSVAAEWISSSESPYAVVFGPDSSGLKLNKTYVLHEKEAPEGFETAEDIEFQVQAKEFDPEKSGLTGERYSWNADASKKLVAVIDGIESEGVSMTDKSSAKRIQAMLTAKKNVSPSGSPEGYSFVLKDKNGNAVETATSDENGDVSFEIELEYDEAEDKILFNDEEIDGKVLILRAEEIPGDDPEMQYASNSVYYGIVLTKNDGEWDADVYSGDADADKNRFAFSNTLVQNVPYHATAEELEGVVYERFERTTGTLTFFRDEPGKYQNDEQHGSVVYYTTDSSSGDAWNYSGQGFSTAAVRRVVIEDAFKPTTCKDMFMYFTNCKSFDLRKLDTSLVSSMSQMFIGCRSTEIFDISTFDSSNVTDMSYMFQNCAGAKAFLTGDWDTSKVTTTRGMFAGCSSRFSFDLSTFDTDSLAVATMMFSGANMELYDFSSWKDNASYATDSIMVNLPADAYLDLSSWTKDYSADIGGSPEVTVVRSPYYPNRGRWRGSDKYVNLNEWRLFKTQPTANDSGELPYINGNENLPSGTYVKLNGGNEFRNEIVKYGNLTVRKKDDGGNPLGGARLAVINESTGELVDVFDTEKDSLYSKNFPCGTYRITEIETPNAKKYASAADAVITLQEDGAEAELIDVKLTETFRIAKIWNDSGFEAERPESVAISLYRKSNPNESVATTTLTADDADEENGDVWKGSFEVRLNAGETADDFFFAEDDVPEGYEAGYSVADPSSIKGFLITFADGIRSADGVKLYGNEQSASADSGELRGDEISGKTYYVPALEGEPAFLIRILSRGTGDGIPVTIEKIVPVTDEDAVTGSNPYVMSDEIRVSGDDFPRGNDSYLDGYRSFIYEWSNESSCAEPFDGADAAVNFRGAKTDVPFEKVWDDDGYESKRPEEAKFALYRKSNPEEPVATTVLTAADADENDSDRWLGLFRNVEMNPNETADDFEIREDVPDGYVVSYGSTKGFVIEFDDNQAFSNQYSVLSGYCAMNGKYYRFGFGGGYNPNLSNKKFTVSLDGKEIGLTEISEESFRSSVDSALRNSSANGPRAFKELTGEEYPHTDGQWETTTYYGWKYRLGSADIYLILGNMSYGSRNRFSIKSIKPYGLNDVIEDRANLTEFEVTKAWDDEGYEDERPEATIDLFDERDMENPVDSMTTAVGGTFENLPKYHEDGSIIRYVAKERPLDGYRPAYGKGYVNGLKITFSEDSGKNGVYMFGYVTPEGKYVFRNEGLLEDNFNSANGWVSGLSLYVPADNFFIDFEKNGVKNPMRIESVEPVRMESLPNAGGNYDYSSLSGYMNRKVATGTDYLDLERDAVFEKENCFIYEYHYDYSQPIAGASTIANAVLKTSVSLTKKWEDEGLEDKRPEEFTIRAFGGEDRSEAVAEFTVASAEKESSSQTVTMEDLPRFGSDGFEAVYSFEETPVENYRTKYDVSDRSKILGFIVTLSEDVYAPGGIKVCSAGDGAGRSLTEEEKTGKPFYVKNGSGTSGFDLLAYSSLDGSDDEIYLKVESVIPVTDPIKTAPWPSYQGSGLTISETFKGTDYPEVSAPSSEGVAVRYLYDGVAEPFEGCDAIVNETTLLKADLTKRWDDEGYESLRPETVSVSARNASAPDEEPVKETTLNSSPEDEYEQNFSMILPKFNEDGSNASYLIEETAPEGYEARYGVSDPSKIKGFMITFSEDSDASTLMLLSLKDGGISKYVDMKMYPSPNPTASGSAAAGKTFFIPVEDPSNPGFVIMFAGGTDKTKITRLIPYLGDGFDSDDYLMSELSGSETVKTFSGTEFPKREAETNGKFLKYEWADALLKEPFENSDLIVNTMTKYEIEKTWEDKGFEDGRPEKITLDLFNVRDMTTPVVTTTVDSVPNGEYSQTVTFAPAPKVNEDGTDAVYVVKERTVSGYRNFSPTADENGVCLVLSEDSRMPHYTAMSVIRYDVEEDKYEYYTKYNNYGQLGENIGGTTLFLTDEYFTRATASTAVRNRTSDYTFKRIYECVGQDYPSIPQTIALQDYYRWDYRPYEGSRYVYHFIYNGDSWEGGKFDVVDGYVPNATEIVNKSVKSDTISFPYAKIWDDEGNAEGRRPETIRLSLYSDVDDNPVRTVEIDAAEDSTSGTFENLPKYDECDHEIQYRIVEDDAPAGYEARYSVSSYGTSENIGLAITFSEDSSLPFGGHIMAYPSRKNGYYAYGLPSGFGTGVDQLAGRTVVVPQMPGDTGFIILTTSAVRYKAVVKVVSVRPVRIDPSSSYYTNNTNLDWYALRFSSSGDEYPSFDYRDHPQEDRDANLALEYRWTNLNGSFDGANVVTNKVVLKNVPFEKIWDDDGAEFRPETITFNLYNVRNMDEAVATKTVDATEEDRISGEFENLPKYNDDGTLAEYTVVEDVPAGYEATYGITDSSRIKGFKVTFSEDADASTIMLMTLKNGQASRYSDMKLYSSPNPTATGVMAAGKTFFVPVEDSENPGFVVMFAGGSNKSEIASAVPVMSDEFNPNDYMLTTVSGETEVSKTFTGTELPKWETETNGKYLKYEWGEPLFNAPFANADSIVNTITEYEVEKIWDDKGFEDDRPEKITLDLFNINDMTHPVATATVDSAPHDKYSQTISFSPAPETNEDGTPAVYVVKEHQVDGYMSCETDADENGICMKVSDESRLSYSGSIRITRLNTETGVTDYYCEEGIARSEGRFDGQIKDDIGGCVLNFSDENFGGSVSSSSSDYYYRIDQTLRKDEIECIGSRYPSSDGEFVLMDYFYWTYRPYPDSKYVYRFAYVGDSWSGGSFEIEDAWVPNPTSITNRSVHEYETQFHYKKIWDDDGNAAGLRPASITLSLYSDASDEPVRSVEISGSEDETSGTFDGLPMYEEDGRRIEYRIVEENVPEYYRAKYGLDGYPGSRTAGLAVTFSEDTNANWTYFAADSSFRQNRSPYFNSSGKTKDPYAGRTVVIPQEANDSGFYMYCNETKGRGTKWTVTDVHPVPIRDYIPSHSYMQNYSTDTKAGCAYQNTYFESSGSYYPAFNRADVEDKNSNSVLYKYEWTGLEESFDGANVITNELDARNLSVEKRWIGDNPEDRPETVTFDAYNANDMETPVKTVSVNVSDADSQTIEFENLPKYNADGTEAEYRIKERPVEGYVTKYGVDESAQVYGFMVTFQKNAYSSGGLSVYSNGRSGKRKIHSADILATAPKNSDATTLWYDGRTIFIPAVDENNLGFILKNQYYRNFNVTKIVPVTNEADVPEYGLGSEVLSTYYLNDGYEYAEFLRNGDFPTSSGYEESEMIIHYSWDKQQDSPSYENAGIYNVKDTRDVEIRKTWIDETASLRPDEITVGLYDKDGNLAATKSIETSEEDSQTILFKDVPTFNEDGTKASYEAREEPVRNYKTAYGISDKSKIKGFLITFGENQSASTILLLTLKDGKTGHYSDTGLYSYQTPSMTGSTAAGKTFFVPAEDENAPGFAVLCSGGSARDTEIVKIVPVTEMNENPNSYVMTAYEQPIAKMFKGSDFPKDGEDVHGVILGYEWDDGTGLDYSFAAADVIRNESMLKRFSVSKRNVKGEEIEGALLQIKGIDEETGNETVLAEWASVCGESHIEYLKPGEYVLHEEAVPETGIYIPASDIEFTIDEDGGVKIGNEAVDELTMTDEYAEHEIVVSKTDVNGDEIGGASLKITGREIGASEDIAPIEWESVEGENKTVSLKPGSYALHEEAVPDSDVYVLAADIAFTVDESGAVKVAGEDADKVTMVDEYAEHEVVISKVDAGGNEIGGARLKIAGRETGATEDMTPVEWTSVEGENKTVSLRPGSYVLHEEAVPDSDVYVLASDVAFTVDENGVVRISGETVDKVTMVDVYKTSGIVVSKTDVGGSEIAGAALTITGRETGASSDITPISWVSGSDGEADGVLLPHVVELKPGSYILHEEAVPDADVYVLASDVAFTVDERGEVKVGNEAVEKIAMTDEYKNHKVKISKKDVGGEEISGAALKVTGKTLGSDEDVVVEWRSNGDEPYELELKPGSYVLHEEAVPDSGIYVKASDTAFTVEKDGTVKVSGEEVDEVTMIDEYAPHEVVVSKTDVNGNEVEGAKLKITGTEIGSETEITPIEWTSVEGENRTVSLKPGSYILHEEAVPESGAYVKASDIAFTVDENGNVKIAGEDVDKVTMIDEYAPHDVEISKTDVNGDEIGGASLKITGREDGASEDMTPIEWTSVEGENKTVSLKPGSYVLHEEAAPESGAYVKASDIVFTVDENGNVKVAGEDADKVTMVDEYAPHEVEISKTDVNGDEIGGASLKITGRETGSSEDMTPIEWESVEGENRKVSLKPGEYVLHEETSPDSSVYVVASDIAFSVDENGNIKVAGEDADKVTMVDEYATHDVVVSKVDVGGNEIGGAKLKITGKETGSSEDVAPIEWESVEGENKTVSLRPGEYVLHEEAVPESGIYVKASDIAFTVEADGTVKVSGETVPKVTMVDVYKTNGIVVSKEDVNGAEIAGASLTITGREAGASFDITPISWISGSDGEVDGVLLPHVAELKPGEYVLHEEAAPESGVYVKASDIAFSVDENGNVKVAGEDADKVTMVDEYAPHDVEISKTDVNGDEIGGAKLKITGRAIGSSEDMTPIEWESVEGENRTVSLKPGEYILHEEAAPNSGVYVKASDIAFSVDENGNVKVADKDVEKVTMVDGYAPHDVVISKTDVNGDEIGGAKLKITGREDGASEDMTPIEWESVEGENRTVSLKPGSYVLHEEEVPDSDVYVAASDIAFSVDENGVVEVDGKDVGKVTMVDEYAPHDVEISKTDVNGKEIAGVTLRITGRETGASEDVAPIEWISGIDGRVDEADENSELKPHKVSLKPGSYVLHEKGAPEGFIKASDVPFEVTKDGKVLVNGSEAETATMTDEYETHSVSVSKTVKGNAGDRTKEFRFTLKLTAGTVAEIPKSIPFVKDGEAGTATPSADGTYEFTLAHGQTMTFSGIPFGTEYEIEEPNAEDDGYSVEKTNATGTVSHDDVEAKFANSKNSGVMTSADERTPFAAAVSILSLIIAVLLILKRRRRPA